MPELPELTKLTMGSLCFSRLTPPHGGVSITYKLATSLSKGEILESGQLQFLPHRLNACSKIEEMQISLCHGKSGAPGFWQMNLVASSREEDPMGPARARVETWSRSSPQIEPWASEMLWFLFWRRLNSINEESKAPCNRSATATYDLRDILGLGNSRLNPPANILRAITKFAFFSCTIIVACCILIGHGMGSCSSM